MSKQLYNLGEINREMAKIAVQVIEGVTKEVLDIFKKDYIKKYVYDGHTVTVYNNDEEDGKFINAWEWKNIKVSATEISTSMFNNWGKMNKDSGKYKLSDKYSVGIHGSEGFDGWEQDERPYMAEILNKRMASGLEVNGKNLSPVRPIGYWDEFISDFVQGGKMKQLVDKHAKKYGLVLK